MEKTDPAYYHEYSLVTKKAGPYPEKLTSAKATEKEWDEQDTTKHLSLAFVVFHEPHYVYLN